MGLQYYNFNYVVLILDLDAGSNYNFWSGKVRVENWI